jgi:hypothetical protein
MLIFVALEKTILSVACEHRIIGSKWLQHPRGLGADSEEDDAQ